ncbi:Na/Pi cotransporter family protein [Thauera butanivorans]|uniref:Na/Pi cotransporter family protein n=1 Tax=Thauera butanivorans TaxID=86174 RepID=UPI003AB7F8E2
MPVRKPRRRTALETAASTPFALFAAVIGGLGLFLIGVQMMTEGLKLAAGRALGDLLERGTATAPRGLAAGYLITALVQSSTAVTVASIGFVNTGLLPLKNALWVVFGSNVGTTMNAWLVATLGFSVKIEVFALPFVGIGALLMFAGRTLRSRSLGQALAGFGILFLGIEVLKDSFSDTGGLFELQDFIAPGLAGWFALIGIGVVLTFIMRATGAVIAIVITAAQGGLISIEAACAVVIGTNIGGSSTAILAAIGATSNARRLAAAHVIFNLVTGAAALLLLPLLIGLLDWLRGVLEQPATPALMIALFHTTFNVLGVLLMVPLAPGMLRLLGRMFRTREEEVARPQHLDANSLAIPDLAMHALRLELARAQGFAVAALSAAAQQPADGPALMRETAALQALAPAIGNYAHRLSAAPLPQALVEQLAHSLRTLRYQETAAVLIQEVAGLVRNLPEPSSQDFGSEIEAFREAVAQLAAASDSRREGFSPGAVSVLLDEVDRRYQSLKEALFLAGAHARLDIRAMQDWLRLASIARRAAKQAAKAARMIAALEEGTSATEAARSEEAEENAD